MPRMPMATCRECKRGVSTEAAACPQCGAPEPGRWMPAAAQATMVRAPRTKHLRHLILTLLTFGFWSPVWAVCAYWDRWNRKREKDWHVGDRVALKYVVGGGGGQTGTIIGIRPMRNPFGPRLLYDVAIDGTHMGSSVLTLAHSNLRPPDWPPNALPT